MTLSNHSPNMVVQDHLELHYLLAALMITEFISMKQTQVEHINHTTLEQLEAEEIQ